MLRLRSLAFDAALYLLLAVMGIAFAPLALWSTKGALFACKTYARTMLRLLRVICGLRTEVRGAIPTGPALIAAKHQSFLDILILTAVLPRPSFVMKSELRWAPIFGLYALRLGATPVRRGEGGRAMQAMLAHVGKFADDPRQLVIYPQGTRVLPGARLPYKLGAGVLYDRLGVPCLPAATNVGVFWARRSPYRRPGLAVVEFLPPIPPGLPVPDFMARLATTVETASDRLMREAGFEPDPPAGPPGATAP